jgi:hypothetical protein
MKHFILLTIIELGCMVIDFTSTLLKLMVYLSMPFLFIKFLISKPK